MHSQKFIPGCLRKLFTAQQPCLLQRPRLRGAGQKLRLLTCAALAFLLTALSVLSAVLTGNASPAQAYTLGPGNYNGDVSVGSFIHSNGTQVYCLEMGVDLEFHKADPLPQTVTALPASTGGTIKRLINGKLRQYHNVSSGAVTGDDLAAINWLLQSYGHTRNNHQAASVQLALWRIRADHGANAQYHRMLQDIIASVDKTAGYSLWSIAMVNEARQAVAVQQQAANSSDYDTLKAYATGGYQGIVEVPADTTQLNIVNGQLQDNAGNWHTSLNFGLAGTSAALTVAWRGLPPTAEGWARHYQVHFSGRQAKSYWHIPAEVQIAKAGAHQTTGTAGSVPHLRYREGVLGGAVVQADTLWEPVVTTAVPQEIVEVGATFGDTVSFAAANPDRPWRYSINATGEKVYMPITATGTLYGPFLADPALTPSATVPADAPVVGTTSVTADTGPGTYPVQVPWQATAAGYYTWVWNIEHAAQPAEVQSSKAGASALPADYFYTDGFGQVSERQIVPTRLKISTELSTKEAVIGTTFTDSVTVNLTSKHNDWLLGEDGAKIPAVLHGYVYYAETEPLQQPAVPSNAQLLGEFDPLILQTAAVPQVSSSFQIPVTLAPGWLTVVWCLRPEEQPAQYRGRIKADCDDYGVPSETLRVVKPAVRTQATPSAGVHGYLHDTAIVSGNLPQLPMRLWFQAYLLPVSGQPQYDTAWQVKTDAAGEVLRWEEAQLAAYSPEQLCQAQPVAVTAAVPVTGAGSYKSPPVLAASQGIVHWQEVLEIADPNTGEYHEVHRGECGLPEETSIISYPQVTSKATAQATPGQKIHDVAIVAGEVVNSEKLRYTATFAAYDVTDMRGNSDNWCRAANKIWQSKKPVAVTGKGKFRSEPLRLAPDFTGTVYWVETLWAHETGKAPQAVHVGVCGAQGEQTQVANAPQLAKTGAPHSAYLVAAALLLLAGAAWVFAGSYLHQDANSWRTASSR